MVASRFVGKNESMDWGDSAGLYGIFYDCMIITYSQVFNREFPHMIKQCLGPSQNVLQFSEVRMVLPQCGVVEVHFSLLFFQFFECTLE